MIIKLWMGTHPNGPSSLYADASTSLKSIIGKESLSANVFEKYSGDLPFLFKVLSIRKALSIQAHPDKELAKTLFEIYPNIYKDPNHKPEMVRAFIFVTHLLRTQMKNESIRSLNS
jgi:mannose-6-phosphate isomerase